MVARCGKQQKSRKTPGRQELRRQRVSGELEAQRRGHRVRPAAHVSRSRHPLMSIAVVLGIGGLAALVIGLTASLIMDNILEGWALGEPP